MRNSQSGIHGNRRAHVSASAGCLAALAVLGLLAASPRAAGKSDVADAAARGDKAAVQALLAQKADVNAPQADGATALHWAVFKGDKELIDTLHSRRRESESGEPRGLHAAVAGEREWRRG